MKMRTTIRPCHRAIRLSRWKVASLCIAAAVCLLGCGPNESILKSNSSTPAPAGSASGPPRSNDPLEKEIEAMKTADFNFIYVLSRRDGAIFTSDDKAFIRKTTQNVNRRTLSDDEKAVIIGSNTKMPSELLDAIRGRLELKDYSKPESISNTGANSNTAPSNAANVR